VYVAVGMFGSATNFVSGSEIYNDGN